jgi:aminoglycoside phosphotransferase (APT) family kinase protein
LRGSATARDGSCTWHLYEDLGPWELDCQASDREPVRAAIALIARIHTRFASHALMGEVRLHGADYGIHFFQTNVQDALCALEAVRPPAERRELCARLLHRLGQLREQLPARAEALTDLGGPETLLHGDLWTINLFVSRNDGALEARLIDWDRAGVGPISYDLSTFLLRFSQPHRAWVLRLYEQAVAQEGWQLPGQQDLNLLFETAELARYANRVIWPAIAWVRDRAAWGFDQLAEVEEWFENLRPVLASATAASTVGPVA